ncbi:MAG TPA: molybdopterin biosynthesis protein [Anaerolineaceae bacterium]|nr:molybdopterin biosynthesis protein [Anaerolineaceae bacterium]HPN50609.1 molybdopterin biosynthesis protein [Anaerolineaceae bacterium]
MPVYLHDIPLPEAQQRLWTALQEAGLIGILDVEPIPLDENALGRVLAEPVWALLSSPHYHASAMDGYAVRSADTSAAAPSNPVQLTCGEAAAYVDTGDPLPEWADAVIPIELIEALDETGGLTRQVRRPAAVRIRAAVSPWSHVRPMGEDIVATELVLPAGQVLRPVDLGALAASGQATVKVARRPRVAVLPTGTELVAVGQPVKRGDIIEYNSIVLGAQVKQWGGEVQRYPITADDFEQICARVKEAAQWADLVLLNAGSSAGSEDFSARVVETLGELLVHGVAVRPGHPVILGMLRVDGEPARQIPIIGVPGYPVSAAITGEIFVEPLLAKWLGRQPVKPITVEAALTRKVASPAGDDDYLRVVVGDVNGRRLAAPLSRGAGVITSLVRADGIAIIPRGIQGKEAGEKVQVRLYRSPTELARTLLVIGSHDLTLDLLAQYLMSRGLRLSSSHAGSLGGLIALSRGEAHLAGSHLMDLESGEYNLTYIRKYLPDVRVKVMGWVERQQGLMVAKGNPKMIRALADLARKDVRLVNRQRGAGTRVLLDFHLGKMGISPEQVQGYGQEEFTHMAVAAAVKSGRADTGLGIAGAAQALDLDFIPLYRERYDLIVPESVYESTLFRPVIELATEEAFRKAVAALPGYQTVRMGDILAEM